MDRKFDESRRIRFATYCLGILIAIVSRFTNLIEYNVAMTVVCFVIVIAFCMEIIVALQQKKKRKALTYAIFAFLLLWATLYVSIFML